MKKTIRSKPGNAPLAVLIMLCLGFAVLLITGKVRMFTVLSGSMAPAIAAGSIAVSVPSGEYQVGDIVTFLPYSGKVTVTHRIVARNGNAFVTKGDANKTSDSDTVPLRSITGKIVAIVPFAGYLFALIRTWPGFIVFIIIPAVIVVILEVRSIFQVLKSRKGI